jgi:hypothetical protein
MAHADETQDNSDSQRTKSVQEILQERKGVMDTQPFRSEFQLQYPSIRSALLDSEKRGLLRQSFQDLYLEAADLAQKLDLVSKKYWMAQAFLSPIQLLPAELLLEIFKCLPPDHRSNPKQGRCVDPSKQFGRSIDSFSLPRFTIFSKFASQHPVAGVCRQWRAILGSPAFVSDYVTFPYPGTSVSMIADWITLCTSNTLINIQSGSLKDNGTLEALCPHFPRLASLRISAESRVISPLFERMPNEIGFPNLSCLVLEASHPGSAPIYNPEVHGPVASISFPRLEFFFIKSAFVPVYLRMHAPALKTLQFENTDPITGEVMDALPLCFPKLEVYRYIIRKIAQAPREPIAFSFKSLKELHVSFLPHAREIDGEVIPLVFPDLKSCTELELIVVAILCSNRGLSVPVQLGLNYAKAFRCAASGSRITFEPHFFGSFPNLEKCELTIGWAGCVYRLLKSLVEHPSYCPHLEHLELRGNGASTDILLETLRTRASIPLKLTWKHSVIQETIEGATFTDFEKLVARETTRTSGTMGDI